jgi:GAF domain-containing protein
VPVSQILSELSGLLENQTWITNLANTSALLMQHLPRLNWVGFYLYDGADDLVLGPFQGLPACLKIPMGKGVCASRGHVRLKLRVCLRKQSI